MKRCSDYMAAAKTKLGDESMSDRELGERIGKSQQAIAGCKHGSMSDPLALQIAAVIGVDPGEVLMVARLEREKTPEVRAAIQAWLGKAFALMPSQTSPQPERRGGGWGVRAPRLAERETRGYAPMWARLLLPLAAGSPSSAAH